MTTTAETPVTGTTGRRVGQRLREGRHALPARGPRARATLPCRIAAEAS
ncbi:hypothetical protein [Microbispora sp. NPDC046933]